MNELAQRIKSKWIFFSVLFGVATLAFAWRTDLSQKAQLVVALTGAILSGAVVGFAHLWDKLWFWGILVVFLLLHSAAWWIVLNVLLAGTRHLFLGVQVGALLVEVMLFVKLVAAIEERIGRAS